MPVIGPGTGASAWSPRDGLPGSSLVAWYDFTDTSTITTDGSNGASNVIDKSLNRYDLSQSTAGSRPVTGNYLGRRGLIFSGAQYLQSVSFAKAQPLTVVGAARLSATTPSGALWDTVSSRVLLYLNAGGSAFFINGNTAEVKGAAPDTLAHVHCGVYNGTTSAIYLDGNVGSTGNVGTGTVSGGVYIGGWQGALATLSWRGWIGELLYWDGALDVKNRRRLETYLGAKHNIPLQTSVTSPPLVFQ